MEELEPIEIFWFFVIFGVIIVSILAFVKVKQEENEREIELRNILEDMDQVRLKNIDNLKTQLSEIQKIEIIDISDFKKIIIDNEKSIIDKGGDNQLFSFMKIDSFLQDFKERIVSDLTGLNDVFDMPSWHRNNAYEAAKLFDLGNVMKPVMEYQIKTMEYYKNMAGAMIVFYLNDKKIRYFEIHEAFEKLGVFDSTWQKNVLNKLDKIEIRLTQISNQLTDLNQNFIFLIKSSENVVSELKEIDSSIMTNNILQAITAYQTWRINKNIKSLR